MISDGLLPVPVTSLSSRVESEISVSSTSHYQATTNKRPPLKRGGAFINFPKFREMRGARVTSPNLRQLGGVRELLLRNSPNLGGARVSSQNFRACGALNGKKSLAKCLCRALNTENFRACGGLSAPKSLTKRLYTAQKHDIFSRPRRA